MATLTDAWANHIYDLVNRATAPPALTDVYLRLHTDDPTAAGSFADEVSGGSYTGQAIASAMGAPTAGTGSNTTQIDFADMPAAVVTHWSKCKTAAGTVDSDEMIEFGAFATPASVTGGATLPVLVGDLDSTAD